MLMEPTHLSFYFNIFKDEIFTVRLLYQLNKFYPGYSVLGIADGPCFEPNIKIFSEINPNFVLYQGKRLKIIGSEFTQRNFEVILEHLKTDIIIGLDPDSYIWRRFNYFPDVDWFGHRHRFYNHFIEKNFTFLGGSCMGFKRTYIQRILDSGYLLNDKYKDSRGFYDRYSSFKKYADPDCNDIICREDWVLGDIARKLKVKPFHWDECYPSQKHEVILQPPYQYAVTHPVRHIF